MDKGSKKENILVEKDSNAACTSLLSRLSIGHEQLLFQPAGGVLLADDAGNDITDYSLSPPIHGSLMSFNKNKDQLTKEVNQREAYSAAFSFIENDQFMKEANDSEVEPAAASSPETSLISHAEILYHIDAAAEMNFGNTVLPEDAMQDLMDFFLP